MRGIIFALLFMGVLWGQEIGRPFVQVGHTGHISSILVTSNEKYLITASHDSTIKVWDFKSGKLIKIYRGHNFGVEHIEFFEKDKLIFSIDSGGIARIWDINSFQDIKTFTVDKHYKKNLGLIFANDIYLQNTSKPILKLIDLFSEFNFKNKNIYPIMILPNNKGFIAVDKNDRSFLYDKKNLNKLKEFKGNQYEISSLSIAPNSQFMITNGGKKHSLIFWNLKTGKKFKQFAKHNTSVNDIVILPDNRRVLTLSGNPWRKKDYSIKMWDIKSGKLLKTFVKNKDYITGLNITPNGKKLIFVDNGNFYKIHLLDIKTNKEVQSFYGNSFESNDIQIFGNVTYLLLDTFPSIKCFDLVNNKLVNIKKYFGAGNTLAINEEKKLIMLPNDTKQLQLFSLDDARVIKKFTEHTQQIQSVAWSKDTKYILTYEATETLPLDKKDYDGKLQLWNGRTGKKIKSFLNNRAETYYNLDISDDNKFALSSSSSSLAIWDINQGKEKHYLKFDTIINDAVFSHDSKYIFLASGHKIFKLDCMTGNILNFWKASDRFVSDLELSMTEEYLLSSDYDGILKFWDTKKGVLLKSINTNRHTDICLSQNEKYIYSSNGTEHTLWNAISGKKLLSTVLFDNDDWVAITPEGYYNASKNGAKHLNVLTGPMTVTSVDAYAEKFYRPDIVKLAMQGKKVDTKVKMSDIKPAPEVEMMHVPQKTDDKQVEITLKIKDMSGGIGDVRIYRNGTAVALKSRDVQRSQKDLTYRTFVIPLEKGKNKLEAIAFESTNSLRSEPAIKNLFASYTDTTKPSLHAVIIGIKEFRNQRLNLLSTKNDAIALKKTLEKHTQTLFDKVDVTLLTSKEETSKENITKVLESLTSLNPNDLFFLFIASHGTVDDGDYYLITSNVGSTRTEKLKKDALSQAEITKLISNIPTGKKLIVLDTCHSGALGESIKVALLQRGMSEDTAIKILSRATGTTILSASLSTQQALEGYKGHGLFSYVLLEGIKGKSDLNGDGFIKTPELVDYIDERVPELSQKVFGVEQFPTVNLDGQAFPITQIVQ